jgi:propionyl-CoA carboxylase alpha chain
MKVALEEFEIDGCKTTIPFCHFAMQHDVFKSGVYDTHFIGQYYDPKALHTPDADATHLAAALLFDALSEGETPSNGSAAQPAEAEERPEMSRWWANRR